MNYLKMKLTQTGGPDTDNTVHLDVLRFEEEKN